MLSSPNKKFVLSRSFLNFLRIFGKLKEQFLRVWENFVPPPGIRPSFFAPGAGDQTKKLPGWPGFARSKKFSRRLPGGCTQLELTEILQPGKLGSMMTIIGFKSNVNGTVSEFEWQALS